MSVTIGDVAARANINKGSVSRILNGKGGDHSAETRKRVLETAAAMGYQPNALARALGKGQTNTVALWSQSPDYYSPYFGYLQHCLQRRGAQHKYHMIAEVVPDLNDEDPNDSTLVNWPFDGILCCYMTSSATNHLLSLIKKRSAIVCIEQSNAADLEHHPNIDYIFADFYGGAKQAVGHLLDSGCQHIALMTMPHMINGARPRAYRELLGEAGQKPEFILATQGSRQGGYEAMKAHVALHGCPDGLFCSNDELAIGCYLALQELGIQVPRDVQLVGFDGLENARYFGCPISSVTVPIEDMCALAWDLLLNRINNPDAPTRRETFPTQLEVRQSSGLSTSPS